MGNITVLSQQRGAGLHLGSREVYLVHYSGDTASSSYSSNRRSLQPLNQQLPATAKWAAGVPVEVQPLALVQMFPRIANNLARLWHDNIGLQNYLDDLLVDRRGGRCGFPPEIQSELLILRAYYEGRYPVALSSA
jgi:hypothetical protein